MKENRKENEIRTEDTSAKESLKLADGDVDQVSGGAVQVSVGADQKEWKAGSFQYNPIKPLPN